MSDARLRELERQWKANGTLQSEAEFHAERVRSGVLEPERLRLAAYLGYAAAVEALRGQTISGHDLSAMIEALGAEDAGTAAERMTRKRRRHQARKEAGKFVSGLEAFGREICLRAAVAVVSLLLPRFESARDPELLRRSYDAALDWLLVPTEERALACARLANEISPSHNDSGWKESAVKLLVQSASDAQGTAMALGAIRHGGSAGRTRIEILNAIRDDLLPFALGYRDPVRERVEARSGEAARE